MAERTAILRKNCERRIVAHGCYGFLSVFGHRRKHGLQIFDRKACHKLAFPQIFA